MKKRDRNSPPPPPPNPYREDCWTDGETSALIESWGRRYLDLNRRNFGHNDWEDMAAAVSSRRRRTGLQCKNRIGTLKKRYKAEKSSAFGSRWPFYSRLDALLGSPSAAENPSPMAAAGSSDSSAWSRPPRKRRTPRRSDRGEGIWLVAQAIVAFTDIYETAGRGNMRRELELQKKRMEFDTMLELKWMKMFSDFMIQCQKRM